MSSRSSSSSRYPSFQSQPVPPSLSLTSRLKSTRPNSKESALVKVKKDQHNFTTMVKKFMEKRSSTTKQKHPIAQPRKALVLTEVNTNTRTLSMVLRSERELLNSNQDQLDQIASLTSLLRERTSEVEKLKDLCLKQREEIKALKTAVLFPDDDVSYSLEGSRIKQAKANCVIPTLQKQISSLTGQLQCLSQDLAEVKASRSIDGSFSLPKTRVFDQEDKAANSLEFSSDELPDSPENMLLKDINPCLTPRYSRMKSKEFEAASSYSYSKDEAIYERNVAAARKLSTSSDHFKTEAFCRSAQGRYRYENH